MRARDIPRLLFDDILEERRQQGKEAICHKLSLKNKDAITIVRLKEQEAIMGLTEKSLISVLVVLHL